MAYTARSRDRFKRLVALVSGVATFTAVVGAGAATGFAARQTGIRDQQRAREQARLAAARDAARMARLRSRAPRVVTVRKKRPHRTVMHRHVVHRVSRTGVAAVGNSGAASSPAPAGSRRSTSSGGSSVTTHSAPAPAPAPAPSPTPAPTSGS